MTIYRFATTLRLLPVLSLIAFSGCEALTGSDDDDLSLGEFRATITVEGEESSFSGLAGHVTEGGEEGTIWLALMFTENEGEEEAEELIQLSLVRYGTRPGPGSYTLADPEEDPGPGDWYATLVALANEALLIAEGVEGTVEITSSSADRVAGTFEIDAIGFIGGEPEGGIQLTIEGDFVADGNLPLN